MLCIFQQMEKHILLCDHWTMIKTNISAETSLLPNATVSWHQNAGIRKSFLNRNVSFTASKVVKLSFHKNIYICGREVLGVPGNFAQDFKTHLNKQMWPSTHQQTHCFTKDGKQTFGKTILQLQNFKTSNSNNEGEHTKGSRSLDNKCLFSACVSTDYERGMKRILKSLGRETTWKPRVRGGNLPVSAGSSLYFCSTPNRNWKMVSWAMLPPRQLRLPAIAQEHWCYTRTYT